jgi:hypothetical protein
MPALRRDFSLAPVQPAVSLNNRRIAVPHGKIHVPELAIYAVKETSSQMFPAYESADAETQAALRTIFASENSFQKRQREQFIREMKNGRAIQIARANHYVFISNAPEVSRSMDSFLPFTFE